VQKETDTCKEGFLPVRGLLGLGFRPERKSRHEKKTRKGGEGEGGGQGSGAANLKGKAAGRPECVEPRTKSVQGERSGKRLKRKRVRKDL